MRKKRRKRIWRIIMWVAVVACIGCQAFIGWYYYSLYRTEKEYSELQLEMQTEAEPETRAVYTLEEIENAEFTGIIDAPDTPVPEGILTEAEENPVDFDKLTEINPELYAWIRVPNTKIDYPIAQHQGEDQTFYLHHDMYQEPQFAGCIYSENMNSRDFSDPVTVLYGHNMKNGSMFQNLYLFQEQTFFDENKYVYIYTPDKIRVYEIVSVYPYDDRRILTSFDFTDEEILEKYLEEIQHPRSMEALVREDVEVSKETPVLTLSTCIAGATDQRLLVQAVLLYEEDGK